ncbi:MAG TPA: acetyl-CoA carboxylase carboxyl transferase subunit alpha, partial [Gemmatales bacterium]|nr:acetyl-CoA carboxylase carboxyl transferase subunit alpha [Gemmatales bacterium]
MPSYLPFEKDIAELEISLQKLEEQGGPDRTEEIRRIQKEIVSLKRKKFANLTPWQTVQVSRHPERPQFLDYVQLMMEEFIELHGDKAIGDDRSLRTGLGRLDDIKVMLIGHHKGRNLQERTECFYGCAHPEGYRKAL